MPLNGTLLGNLKPEGTPKKLADSEGLDLYLSASGGKLWRMDSRFGGKRKTLNFGAHPVLPLKEARRKRDKAKELLTNGIESGAQKKAVKEEAEAAARAQTGPLWSWPGNVRQVHFTGEGVHGTSLGKECAGWPICVYFSGKRWRKADKIVSMLPVKCGTGGAWTRTLPPWGWSRHGLTPSSRLHRVRPVPGIF